ncbi:MAG: hypothetical protein EAS52_25840 [Parapedobacter sp.]|nr:MAG: hypothetical protein EAS52_25840 [Parapedobacter sp.]
MAVVMEKTKTKEKMLRIMLLEINVPQCACANLTKIAPHYTGYGRIVPHGCYRRENSISCFKKSVVIFLKPLQSGGVTKKEFFSFQCFWHK